jgi:hypothetical protein
VAINTGDVDYTVIKSSYRWGGFRSQVPRRYIVCAKSSGGRNVSLGSNLVFQTIPHYAGSRKVVREKCLGRKAT